MHFKKALVELAAQKTDLTELHMDKSEVSRDMISDTHHDIFTVGYSPLHKKFTASKGGYVHHSAPSFKELHSKLKLRERSK
jgi:hypothetical protein